MLWLRLLSPLRGLHSFSRSNPGLTPGAALCRPLRELVARNLSSVFAGLLLLTAALSTVAAQTDNSPFPQPTALQHGPPLSNQEFVRLLYQLPAHPEERDKLIDEIRKRGIAFPVTAGLQGLVATKSGNDSLLRHTLEEADRRRANPVAAALPPTAEALGLLAQTRKATLGAAEKMPDYLVKEQIVRYMAEGNTRNWRPDDHLTVAVSYRQSSGEDYKLLSVNGVQPKEEQSYGMKLGGTTSAGEYASVLRELFSPESRAEFNMVDTDTLRGRRTIIYEYVVKREFSHSTLAWGDRNSATLHTIAGYRGRIWVDREQNRILRLEEISTEIEPGFPITAASQTIDYDWVTINQQQHLLPSHAVIELTDRGHGQTIQTRNEISFRGYRKFGTEVKIIDIDEKDFPPDKPEEEPAKPDAPPVLKPAPKKPKP